MRADAVLILSGDPDIGALLAAMLELGGYQAVFARDDERPEEAIARHGPRAVFVDCDLSDAWASGLYRAGAAHGATVILFSPGRPWDDVARRAAPRGLPFFALPIRPAELVELAENPWRAPASRTAWEDRAVEERPSPGDQEPLAMPGVLPFDGAEQGAADERRRDW
jgi:DNA-binding NtrC family response regulator